MARPTKYTKELLKKARSYIEPAEKDPHRVGHVPTIAGLAVHLGVRRETLHVWAKEEGKEEFSNIYERLMALQEQNLLVNGLRGDYNSTITKLMLTKHGYTDKQEQTLQGPEGAPVVAQVIYNPVEVDGRRRNDTD